MTHERIDEAVALTRIKLLLVLVSRVIHVPHIYIILLQGMDWLLTLEVLLHSILIVHCHLCMECVSVNLHLSLIYIHTHLIQEIILLNLLVPQKFLAEIIGLLEIESTSFKAFVKSTLAIVH